MAYNVIRESEYYWGLITHGEVAAKVNVAQIDPHTFLAAIEIAEERFVVPVLGYTLYNDLVNQKNIVVTSGNASTLQPNITLQAFNGAGTYQLVPGDIVNAYDQMTTAAYIALWKNKLWKFVAECVYLVSIPENYAQFTSAGIVKTNPSPSFLGGSSQALKSGESAGIDLKDAKWLVDESIMNRIEPLRVGLVNYLCANAASLPLYDSSHCVACGDQPGKFEQKEKKTSFVTGIYAKDDRRERRIYGEFNDGWGHDLEPYG